MRARIPNSYFLLLNSRYCPYEGDRVGGNGLAAADGVDPLVGFSFDAHARGVDADRLRDGRPHRVNMIANLRRLEYEPASRHQTMQVVPGAGATGSRGCRSAKAFALRKADAFVLRKADAFALRTADAFALPRAEAFVV